MKLRTNQRVHYDSGPNMTPLVDVVMVLLIFMMLTGSFVGAEHYLVSSVPARKTGVGQQTNSAVPDDNDLPIFLEMNSTGDGFLSLVGSAQASDKSSLTAALKKKFDDYQLAKTDPKQVTVVISATPSVRYKYVVSVFEAANDAGFEKITFQARTKRN